MHFPRRARLLLVFLSLLAVGWLSGHLPAPSLPGFKETNAAYLDDAFDRALAGFGILSGFKAALAVVEGSTGGVNAGLSLQLQIGDVVQAVYDYVDVAWRALLLGCLSLLSWQYLLTAIQTVSAPLAGATAVLAGLRILLAPAKGRFAACRRALTELTAGSLFLLLMLTLVVPASIRLAAVLSDRITAPALAEASEGFAVTAEEMFPDGFTPRDGFLETVRGVPDQVEHLGRVLRERSRHLGRWTVQLIAGYLFDCLIFPLGVFLLLGGGVRALWRYGRAERRFARLLAEIRSRASSP